MRRRTALTVISGGTITLLAGCSSSGEPDSSDQDSDDDENNSSETNNSVELNVSDEDEEIEGPAVEVETSYEIEEGTVSDEIYAVGTVENVGEITADIMVDFEVHEQDGEYGIPLLEDFEDVEPGEVREFRLGPARVDEEDLEDTAINASGVRSN